MIITANGGGSKDRAVDHTFAMADELIGNSNVLIIPSACSTVKSYDRKVPASLEYFTELKRGEVTVLHDFQEKPSRSVVEDRLAAAGLVYVLGGNTPHMFKLMKEHGSDVLLADSVRKQRVALAGTSAGAILPFTTAQMLAAPRPAEVEWEYEYTQGLGILEAAVAVHANKHDVSPSGLRTTTRLEEFLRTFPENESVGYGIEEGAALTCVNGLFSIVRAESSSNIHLVTRAADGTIESRIFE